VRIVLLLFLALSVLGMVLCVCVHVVLLLGLPCYDTWMTLGLFFGVIVVYLVVGPVSTELTKGFKQRDSWKVQLRGCPGWLKRVNYVIDGYVLLFLLIAALTGSIRGSRISFDRSMSALLLALYSGALLTLYSAIRVARSDTARRCPKGHPVSLSANFCAVCGAPVQDRPKT